MLLRINIFKNGDTRRQRGRVILLERSDNTSSFQLDFGAFLIACAKKLQFSSFEELTAYTSRGGRLEELRELLQDDVLFLAHSNEAFLNYTHPYHLSCSNDDSCVNPSLLDDLTQSLVVVQPRVVPTTPTTTAAETKLVAQLESHSLHKNEQQAKMESTSATTEEQHEKQAQQHHFHVHIKSVQEMMSSSQTLNSTSKNNTSALNDEYLFITENPERRKVKSVKKWLSKKLGGCHVDDITLVKNGQSLKTDQHLIDLFDMMDKKNDEDDVENVNHHITMFMVVKPMVIHIRQMRGGKTTITMSDNISHNTLIRDIKHVVMRRTGLTDVRLVFNQREMADGEKLSTYEVMSGALVYAL